jgi:hypothetical protein
VLLLPPCQVRQSGALAPEQRDGAEAGISTVVIRQEEEAAAVAAGGGADAAAAAAAALAPLPGRLAANQRHHTQAQATVIIVGGVSSG